MCQKGFCKGTFIELIYSSKRNKVHFLKMCSSKIQIYSEKLFLWHQVTVFISCVVLPSLRYFQPLQLIVGATVVTLMFVGFVWAAENQAPVRRFRRNHPLLTVLAILLASYLFVSVLGGVAVFLFGIAFPVLSE